MIASGRSAGWYDPAPLYLALVAAIRGVVEAVSRTDSAEDDRYVRIVDELVALAHGHVIRRVHQLSNEPVLRAA